MRQLRRERALVGILLAALSFSTCLNPWSLSGPYACAADGTCLDGFTCDDGVCCRPGGTPACPTLPVDGVCPSGAPQRFFRDLDQDGFGAGQPRLFCALPQRESWVAETRDGGLVPLDCDDSDAGLPFNPLAQERCNGLDDNCNGVVDEGLMPQTPWYRDTDGDGFGEDSARSVMVACGRPPGFSARAGDCDIMRPGVFPGAPEHCDNVDENCNGVVDDPPLADAETPGVPGSPSLDCSQGQGVCQLGGTQCQRDAVSQRNALVCVPRMRASTEVCDGLDNDCDGVVDNPPGCGGPTGFLTTPRVQFGAFRVPIASTAQPSKLPQRCLKGLPTIDAQSWFNPTWVGAQAEVSAGGTPLRHTWFAEAEPGTTWDLSRRTVIRVALRDRSQLGSNLFATAHFPGPVVTLCGALDSEYLRFSPTVNELSQNGTLQVDLGLIGNTTGWTREQSAGFSPSRVARVELTVGPFPVANPGPFDVKTLSILVLPDAGFPR
jgi:hypothetical protein